MAILWNRRLYTVTPMLPEYIVLRALPPTPPSIDSSFGYNDKSRVHVLSSALIVVRASYYHQSKPASFL